MLRTFANTELYDNTTLSFRIDYYSPILIDNQAKTISKLVNKPVVFNNKGNVKKDVSSDHIKIYPNLMDNNNMHRIEIGVLPYTEAINVLTKILGYIREKGHTNDNCSLITNVSVDGDNIVGHNSFIRLNKLKFVAGLNEDIFFKSWKPGKRMVNKSLKDFIIPKKMFYDLDTRNIVPELFEIPSSKYFGIDFDNVTSGYITMKYVGGTDYENNVSGIVEGISYIVDRIGEVLKSPDTYTAIEMAAIKNSLNKHKENILKIRTYDMFKERFPTIRLFVDLRNDHLKIKFHYNRFKELLFTLIVNGNLQRGLINYDSDTDKFQIKDTNILYVINLKDVEIYDSIVSGDFLKCYFENCKIRSSKLIDSIVDNRCLISNSSLYRTVVRGDNNKIANSFLSDCGSVNADIRLSVLRKSTVPYFREVDNKTKIIDY